MEKVVLCGLCGGKMLGTLSNVWIHVTSDEDGRRVQHVPDKSTGRHQPQLHRRAGATSLHPQHPIRLFHRFPP